MSDMGKIREDAAAEVAQEAADAKADAGGRKHDPGEKAAGDKPAS